MTKTKSDVIRDNISILTDNIERDKHLLNSKKMPDNMLQKKKKQRQDLMLEYLYYKGVENGEKG